MEKIKKEKWGQEKENGDKENRKWGQGHYLLKKCVLIFTRPTSSSYCMSKIMVFHLIQLEMIYICLDRGVRTQWC